MIVVRVDLEKFGDACDRTALATIKIINDGSGDSAEGSYSFSILTPDGKSYTGKVYDHWRVGGVLPLLQLVLNKALQ